MNESESHNCQKDNITISSWNSRGLVAALPYLNKLMLTSDIITISEHWLQENRLNVLLEISNDFNVVARSSKHAGAGSYGSIRGQGGVALLWRKSLAHITPISNLTHDRICGVRVPLQDGRTLLVYSVYLPSQGSKEDFRYVLDEIYDIVYNDNPNELCMICGDFNGDVGYLGGPRSTRPPSKQGQYVSNFLNEIGLLPANLCNIATGPVNTFMGGMGSSTLDYLAIPTSLRSCLVSCEVLDEHILNTSDHLAITMTLSIVCGINNAYKAPIKGKILWEKGRLKGKLELYRKSIAGVVDNITQFWDFESTNSDGIDNIFDTLASGILAADKVIPRSSPSFHARPYWNESLNLLKKQKVSAYRAWKLAGQPRDALNPFWRNHKEAKKAFRRAIKKVQREYEQKEIDKLVESANTNKNRFWKILKRKRNQKQSESIAIKPVGGSTVYGVNDVVEIWKDHFTKICAYDETKISDWDHHNMVTNEVNKWFNLDDTGQFYNEPITHEEIQTAILTLNSGKSPGYDEITAEHLKFGGVELMGMLVGLYNQIVNTEHIPRNFRTGTQIPLYKGKNLCSLDPNNYRGITLLTCFNKLFEIVTWNRLKEWWGEQNVISPLQGACTKGSSCLHTAAILQEAIAVGLDTNKKVFVAYYDVAKAFDSVWIDGLFYQLRKKGLVGKEWRLLYSSYINFRCKVRLRGVYSDWYPMQCGIHQGGYLSLLKYAAFIDPLLREVQESGVGCQIDNIPVCPLGYADDMATACPSRLKLDESLRISNSFAMKWEYRYNAKKSAIMIYGEKPHEHKKGRKYRTFRLGKDKVQETIEYDHVGVKNCLFGDFSSRVEERISKGRRSFNSILNSGVKRNGLSMSVISSLFWTIVVPIVTYGSEVWVLKGEETDSLRKFQRYVGRRSQRFHQHSPNFSAYAPLGWISLEKVVFVKKLLFFRSICIMKDTSPCKRILVSGVNAYNADRAKGSLNLYNSPVYELCNIAGRVNLLDICLNMVLNGHFYNKKQWSRMVWEKVWILEDEEIQLYRTQITSEKLLFQVAEKPYYLTWWVISDISREHIPKCENMAKMVCDASLLKTSDVRLKKKSIASRFCNKCDHSTEETAKHIIMQCSHFEADRKKMFEEMSDLNCPEIDGILNNPGSVFWHLMGRQPPDIDFAVMYPFWIIAARYISSMYERTILGR